MILLEMMIKKEEKSLVNERDGERENGRIKNELFFCC